MSAIRSLTIFLTLSCLVRAVVASDLAYVDGESTSKPNDSHRNELVWVQQSHYQTTIASPVSNQRATSPDQGQLKSKFSRFGQKHPLAREPEIKLAGDHSDPSQQIRLAPIGHQQLVTNLVNPRAEQVKSASSKEIGSNSFIDRLRQLSSSPRQADLPPTTQVAAHEEPNRTAPDEVDGLVYIEEVSAGHVATAQEPKILLTQVYSEQLEQALSALPAVESIEISADEPAIASTRVEISEPATIVFRPAVVDVNSNGQPVLRPDVYVAGQITPPSAPGATESFSPLHMEELPATVEPIVPDEWAVPIVDGAYEQYMSHTAPRLGPIQELCCRVGARLHGPVGCEPGLGTERVMHAISFVETSQPMNNFRIRFDSAYDYQTPDRAEYFWAAINGRGPATNAPGVPEVDYQDIRTYMEVGGDKFSVGTDVPIRILDPNSAFENTSGLGDINITTKLVFLDGKFWQIANLFRTYIPSGDPSKGLGTGHASIEPGFAIRYKYSDYTYFHGDLKYWVPLGGDPIFAGEVLNYGIAMSHVWRETDTTAIMPTIELKAYSFLDGRETRLLPGGFAEPDPEGILMIHPGVRWAWDHGTDCGLREIGVFGGFSATSNSLYEELIRLEFRWNW